MKITKSKKIFAVLTAAILLQGCFVLCAPHPASAGRTLWDMQEGMGKDGAGNIGKAFGQTDGANPTDIRDVVISLIKIFLTFTGIILIIIVIIGGYQWMTAGANGDKVHEAQSRIKAALIGIIIVLAAYTITNFVAHCVTNILSDDYYWMCGT